MRAAIYARVSSDEQVDGFSLDAQRRAMLEYCASRGWNVEAEYVDEGKSARGDELSKRPAFQRMMADVSGGRIDVVVVHKLDRFARNIRVTFEQFQILQRHRVLFASVSEQGFDFTTPMGQVILSVLAAFAQYYSDNLATEVRKGKAERKAQGLYNGLLPFGVKKNSFGIPVPDPTTYPGLLLAFESAAKGMSDREVAVTLNDHGYRSTGNRGRNPFTKDTVRAMLQNRFYLGELPDGSGNWMAGAHDALLDDKLFQAALDARARRVVTPLPVRRQARVYSLSGLLRCHRCGGTLHLHRDRERARAYCYRGRQGVKCDQRSTFLDVYEAQVVDYLATFSIPEGYRDQLVAAQGRAQSASSDVEGQRRQLEAQLGNARTLFELGDITKADYLERRRRLQQSLEALKPACEVEEALEKAARFLTDLPAAWHAATDQQRNALARLLFEEVRIQDEWVAAVKSQPIFASFFELDCQARRLSGGSDGDQSRNCTLPAGAMIIAEPPERNPVGTSRRSSYQQPRHRKLSSDLLKAIQQQPHHTLRELAAEYGVSHETIRAARRARTPDVA